MIVEIELEVIIFKQLLHFVAENIHSLRAEFTSVTLNSHSARKTP